MIKRKYWISALLALLLLFPLAALAAPVGKISNLVGNVDITVTGKTARIAILGEPVNVGDFIRTKSKSKVEITFNEGHILRLAENTRVGITEYMSSEKKSSSRFNLFRGRIQNIVKSIGIGGRYEVQTPTAVCGVRGTWWFAGQEDGKTDVAVLEGTVSATSYLPAETPGGSPQSVELILNTGQGTVMNGINPPQISPVSNQQFNQLINSTTILGSSGNSGGIIYGGSGGTISDAGVIIFDGGSGILSGGTLPPPPPPPPPNLTNTNAPPLVVPPPVQPVQPGLHIGPASPAPPPTGPPYTMLP